VNSAALIRDRYELLDALGRGAQGEVWKALDRQHGRVVALKIRPADDEERRHELLGEARILLTLRPHEGVPVVREDFFWKDRYVLVMDWVEGTDLGAILLDTGDPGLPVSSVLAWLAEAARAIDHLHTHGIVHGDVKPANLVLGRDGHVVLVDFGISQPLQGAAAPGISTPGYAAPEVVTGRMTAAADVYSLAATAVALLTGSSPSAASAWDSVPNAATIDRAVRRGLDTDPERRPRSAAELVERLQAHLTLDLPTGVVTFLLTDIAGSTLRWESEPDVMSALLSRHDGLMAEAVEAAGGRLLKTRGEGDSTFSVFTKASGAVVAALEAQHALQRSTDLSVRMAIHTGEAEMRDGDYYGRTVNRAARLRGIASGGQVVLSSAAADLVVDALPDGASLVDFGFHELRDLARGEQVFALAHANLDAPVSTEPARDQLTAAISDSTEPVPRSAAEPAPAPAPAPALPSTVQPSTVQPSTVHRASLPEALAQRAAHPGHHPRELDIVRDAFATSRQRTRVFVLLSDDDGEQASNVAAVLAAEADDDGAVVLYGCCTEDGDRPYEPFADALVTAVEAAARDEALLTLGPLAAELTRLAPEAAATDAVPLRADPETEQYRLFDAVSSWLHTLAGNAPVVLVIDALQRAKPDTVRLLRHLLRSTDRLPMLIVAALDRSGIGPTMDADHGLRPLLADLARLQGIVRLTVERPGEAIDPR
jgi:class 3 adenylate cyclase/predicted Ser/Thr protein kinase